MTQEQVRLLEAAQELLGARWLAVDMDGTVQVSSGRPSEARDGRWRFNILERDCARLPKSSPLASLTTWERGPVEIETLLHGGKPEICTVGKVSAAPKRTTAGYLEVAQICSKCGGNVWWKCENDANNSALMYHYQQCEKCGVKIFTGQSVLTTSDLLPGECELCGRETDGTKPLCDECGQAGSVATRTEKAGNCRWGIENANH